MDYYDRQMACDSGGSNDADNLPIILMAIGFATAFLFLALMMEEMMMPKRKKRSTMGKNEPYISPTSSPDNVEQLRISDSNMHNILDLISCSDWLKYIINDIQIDEKISAVSGKSDFDSDEIWMKRVVQKFKDYFYKESGSKAINADDHNPCRLNTISTVSTADFKDEPNLNTNNHGTGLRRMNYKTEDLVDGRDITNSLEEAYSDIRMKRKNEDSCQFQLVDCIFELIEESLGRFKSFDHIFLEAKSHLKRISKMYPGDWLSYIVEIPEVMKLQNCLFESHQCVTL